VGGGGNVALRRGSPVVMARCALARRVLAEGGRRSAAFTTSHAMSPVPETVRVATSEWNGGR